MGSHKKRRKSETTSSDTSSDTDEDVKKRKKHKSSKKIKKRRESTSSETSTTSSDSSSSSEEERKSKKQRKKEKDIPLHLMEKAKAMVPMTKEEWEKRQNTVKRAYDESTGRHRLIKGDGEVIEEIVSRDRHRAINQQATRGDGDFFQSQMSSRLKK